ncbi:MAG: nitroreductase family protein [Desulfatiglandaceae bacterium]|jgi:nitroreductase
MLLSLLEKRRSIRKYQDKKVEPEKIDKLIEAALRAPSSIGRTPWEFVVVTDQDILQKLGRAKEHGSMFIKGAPLGIVVCADPKKSDIWVEDASIASIIIHLAAASLDLGSCWIQIRERMHQGTEPAEGFIAEVLGLPSDLKVLSMIAVGYPDEEKAPHEKETLPYDKVHLNNFGSR